MELLDAGEPVHLALSRAELHLLSGSVDETLEAVDDREFSTRLGAEEEEARALRAELGQVISQLPHLGS